jgi:hypothetical protein
VANVQRNITIKLGETEIKNKERSNKNTFCILNTMNRRKVPIPLKPFSNSSTPP